MYREEKRHFQIIKNIMKGDCCSQLIFHLFFIEWIDVNNQISTSTLHPPISKSVYELSF